jgi:hypothetical protein
MIPTGLVTDLVQEIPALEVGVRFPRDGLNDSYATQSNHRTIGGDLMLPDWQGPVSSLRPLARQALTA